LMNMVVCPVHTSLFRLDRHHLLSTVIPSPWRGEGMTVERRWCLSSRNSEVCTGQTTMFIN